MDRSTASSPRSFAAKDGWNSPKQDREIGHERRITQIAQVHLDHGVIPHVAATADLPDPGHAGCATKAQALSVVIHGDLARERGTWTHEAHLAAKHIYEVWKLVEAGASQERSHPCDPGILTDLEDRPIGLIPIEQFAAAYFRVRDHR